MEGIRHYEEILRGGNVALELDQDGTYATIAENGEGLYELYHEKDGKVIVATDVSLETLTKEPALDLSQFHEKPRSQWADFSFKEYEA